MPEVSVVIPCFNAAKFLPAAIDSVLSQDFRDVEVLVVDDGSTDGTELLMVGRGSPVRYLRQANAGVSVARNHGIAESRGRLVAFLDADDTWLAGKLSKQVAALDSCPSCRVCYSAFVVVDWELRPLEIRRSVRGASTLESLLTCGNVVGSVCTVVGERSLLTSAGSFDASLSQCADWDLWVRLAASTEFLYLDEPLVTYRQHDRNMSRDARLLEADSLRVLEKGFSLPALPARLQAARRRAFARNDMVLAGTYYRARMWRDFLRCAGRSLSRDPFQAGRLLGYPVRLAARWRPFFLARR